MKCAVCPEETGSDAMYWCGDVCYRSWSNAYELEKAVEEEARIRRAGMRPAVHWVTSYPMTRVAE